MLKFFYPNGHRFKHDKGTIYRTTDVNDYFDEKPPVIVFTVTLSQPQQATVRGFGITCHKNTKLRDSFFKNGAHSFGRFSEIWGIQNKEH